MGEREEREREEEEEKEERERRGIIIIIKIERIECNIIRCNRIEGNGMEYKPSEMRFWSVWRHAREIFLSEEEKN